MDALDAAVGSPPPISITFGTPWGESPLYKLVARLNRRWAVAPFPPLRVESTPSSTSNALWQQYANALLGAPYEPAQGVNGLVATGAFELETTEFTPAGTYTPGEDVTTITPEQAASLVQRWGVDEIDEVTRREIFDSFMQSHSTGGINATRPHPATNATARTFTDRAVISWDHYGEPVEKFLIQRAVDGEDEYTLVAELPGTARKYVDRDFFPDLICEYWIDTQPACRMFFLPCRVTIGPEPTMSMRERLDWQSRACCMTMFGTPYYPGIEHFQSRNRTVSRVMAGLQQNMQDAVRAPIHRPWTPGGQLWLPDMP